MASRHPNHRRCEHLAECEARRRFVLDLLREFRYLLHELRWLAVFVTVHYFFPDVAKGEILMVLLKTVLLHN